MEKARAIETTPERKVTPPQPWPRHLRCCALDGSVASSCSPCEIRPTGARVRAMRRTTRSKAWGVFHGRRLCERLKVGADLAANMLAISMHALCHQRSNRSGHARVARQAKAVPASQHGLRRWARDGSIAPSGWGKAPIPTFQFSSSARSQRTTPLSKLPRNLTIVPRPRAEKYGSRPMTRSEAS